MTSETENYKEQVQVFDLKGRLLGLQDRTKFYEQIRKEYSKKKKITKQVHTIRLFLMNSKGGIYFAKRSKLKKENSLLYDKTIGGHIRGIESAEFTVVRECAEELGIPATVLNRDEFSTGISEVNLSTVGLFKEIETIKNFSAKYKYKNGKFVVFPQITTVFVGIFDGSIKFHDGETSGVEIYYLDEVMEELDEFPEKYTEDVKVLLPKYLKEFKKIIKQI
jgi:isopentenyldiphosphate isomerase